MGGCNWKCKGDLEGNVREIETQVGNGEKVRGLSIAFVLIGDETGSSSAHSLFRWQSISQPLFPGAPSRPPSFPRLHTQHPMPSIRLDTIRNVQLVERSCWRCSSTVVRYPSPRRATLRIPPVADGDPIPQVGYMVHPSVRLHHLTTILVINPEYVSGFL